MRSDSTWNEPRMDADQDETPAEFRSTYEPLEEWRAVVGYEDYYQVSDLGRVRSLARMKPLVGSYNADGYHTVTLWTPHGQVTQRVYRLVCTAFNGPPNALHREVAHLDGSRDNDCATNLKWVSHAENVSHKRAHGTHGAGEKHPGAKLTESAVRDIIALLMRGATCWAVARKHGVSAGAVESIRRGKNWRHIPRPDGFYAPRSTGQAGSLNHWAKLNDHQVMEIRRRAALGESIPALGREFGVSRAVAYKVVARTAYRNAA